MFSKLFGGEQDNDVKYLSTYIRCFQRKVSTNTIRGMYGKGMFMYPDIRTEVSDLRSDFNRTRDVLSKIADMSIQKCNEDRIPVTIASFQDKSVCDNVLQLISIANCNSDFRGAVKTDTWDMTFELFAYNCVDNGNNTDLTVKYSNKF